MSLFRGLFALLCGHARFSAGLYAPPQKPHSDKRPPLQNGGKQAQDKLRISRIYHDVSTHSHVEKIGPFENFNFQSS